MRANEFLKESDSGKTITINIPITITIPSGNGDPAVSIPNADDDIAPGELPEHPIQIFPLQQELELLKHKSGLRSPVINQLLHDKGALSNKEEGQIFDLNEDFEWLHEEFRKSSKHHTD